MSRINDGLQKKIDAFENKIKESPELAQRAPEMIANLRACIESSPALIEQMNMAVDQGVLKSFGVQPADIVAGARYKSDKIEIPLSALTAKPDGKFNIHDLAFVLGHETQHGFNAEERAQAVAIARKDMGRIARSKTDDSYDSPTDTWQQAARVDEAKSSLAGWNAAVSQLKQEGKEVTLETMATTYGGRAADFIDTLRDAQNKVTGYQLKDGISLKGDMTIDIDDPDNIAALGKYYYDKPDRAIGYAKSSYPNLVGADIMSQAVQLERYYHSNRMTINLASHGMQEDALEKNGIDLGRRLDKQPRQPYIDTSYGQMRESHFDHTVDARVSASQVHQYVPIAPALSSSRRRGFDDPDHPDHALYAEIKQRLPPETSPDRLAQITLAASNGGVKAGQIDDVTVRQDAVFVKGQIPGDGAKVDLTTPPPPQEQTARDAEQLNQQRQQQVQQWQEIDRQAQQQSNPAITR